MPTRSSTRCSSTASYFPSRDPDRLVHREGGHLIVVRIVGGLGNQMFQYALGRRLALARDADLKLDLAWFRHNPSRRTPRPYEIDRFDIRATTARDHEVPYRGPSTLRRMLRTPLPGQRLHIVQESGLAFQPEVLDVPDHSYLIGYWISERYFSDVADVIREEFSVLEPLSAQDADTIAEIEACESISVHVRRGDFVDDARVRSRRASASLDYYREAIEGAAAGLTDPRLFVFSDDPEWCRQNLPSSLPTRLVTHNDATRSHRDLRLMSRCRHHVVANSSFSWWGAWLDPRPDKRVFAPRHVYRDPSVDVSSVYPAGWTLIE